MLPHVHAALGEAYAGEGRTTEAIAQIRLGLVSDEDGGLHYRLLRLYSKTVDRADAEAALAQMKTFQQQRRQASMIAVQDSQSSSLQDEP
jgi:predicted Zn-dependent protease